jgi:hypothetical protein
MNDEPTPATLRARSVPPISSARRWLIDQPDAGALLRRTFAAEPVEGLEQLVIWSSVMPSRCR